MDKLQGAQLQVVLSGTRASFRRRVMDAMGSLIPASGAFCFFGRDDARAYGDGTRLVDQKNRPLQRTDGVALSAAFGFDLKSVVAAPRRAGDRAGRHDDHDQHAERAQGLAPAEVQRGLPERASKRDFLVGDGGDGDLTVQCGGHACAPQAKRMRGSSQP